eukprot:6839976-Alexandrium_andersonii.AAC.1
MCRARTGRQSPARPGERRCEGPAQLTDLRPTGRPPRLPRAAGTASGATGRLAARRRPSRPRAVRTTGRQEVPAGRPERPCRRQWP